MGKRRLGNLAREICLFAAPIPEAASEAVHRRVMNAHAAHRLSHRHVRERLGKALTGKDKVAGPVGAKPFADLDGAQPHALHEMVLQAVERPLLKFALDRAGGNQSAAADLLGINRNTLRKKLHDYRLV